MVLLLLCMLCFKYRSLINSNKATYLISTKEEKTAISRSIVATIRKQQGRFLERGKDQIWYDIGDAKATEKTSQALREGQPDLRQKMIDRGIIKDPSTSPPGIVEIVTPQSKQELVVTADAASTMPDNNCHTNNFSGHHGSNLFARDYINIIFGHNNDQYPQSMRYSLDDHLLEKNKVTTTRHPYNPSDQQQLAFLHKKHPDDCEDTTMVHSPHHQSNSQRHHSSHLNNDGNNNRGIERRRVDDGGVIANTTGLDDSSSHSIMTFDIEIDDDDSLEDDDLLDDDYPLPPNYYHALSDQGNDDDTMNYSEKAYQITKSLPSNSQQSDNDSYSHHHQYHHPNHQQPHNDHGNRYFEYENEDENNRTATRNNTFEDTMWDDGGEDYNDDDSGIISLGFLSSVMSPTTETNPYCLLEKRRTHTI
jgi:hypothetical protein